MQTRVQKWGNSLAVRIPKSFLGQSKLKQNALVDITIEDGGKIVILPVQKKKEYTLEELLKGMTREHAHDEVDFGPPVGNEIFEYE